MRRLLLCGLLISFSLSVGGVLAADDEKKSDADKPTAEQVKKDVKPADGEKAVKKEEAKAVKEEPKKAAKKPAAEKKAKVKKAPAKTEKKPVKPEVKKEEPKTETKSIFTMKKKSETKPVQAGPPKTNVVRFTIKGDYPEGPNAPGLLSEMQPSMVSLIEKLDAAAADKDVAAVWLRIEDLALGRGKIYDLRQAIGRVRKAHKPVYAELTTAETGQYLVAAACDKIWMPECGILIIPGVRMEVTFFKGLLDKIGLQFDVLQMGKFKGAGEPFSRMEMSKPLRESYDAVADDIYADLVETLTADRKMKDYKVKTLIDQGVFDAQAAQRAGLIDQILYPDAFEELLKKDLKTENINVVTNYRRKKRDTDFSGIGGMMKFLQLMMGKEPGEAASAKQKIAVVYAIGPIMEGKSQSDIFGDSTLGSTTLVAALKKAAEDPKVLAVVMRVDSPGGSAVASDLVWRETLRVKQKKPFLVSMSDVAGSGGYYIAMGAQKIFAAPDTITGSIGVIGGKLVTKGLYDKLGLRKEIISRGANSGAFSSAAPYSPEERRVVSDMMQSIYRQFVGKAAQGRKMPYEKLESLAQGRIYTGRTAKQLGLIDEVGTLHDAIAAAKQAAGLKPDADVDILMLPQPRSFFEQLFGDPSANSDIDSLLPDAVKLLRQSRLLKQIFAQPAALWMPYQVEVK